MPSEPHPRSTLADGFAPRLQQHAFKLLSLAVVTLLGTGTVVYRILEDWSWVDSFYFSAIAVTTVGFGDVTPTRDASKLFTVGYVLTGIGIITAYLNERLRRAADRFQRRSDDA